MSHEPTAPKPAPISITMDDFLGGRLRLRQPAKGHRAGIDAILLAAACNCQAGDLVVDFGAGIGAAGLAVAARVARARAKLVEIDPATAALARQNAADFMAKADGAIDVVEMNLMARNAAVRMGFAKPGADHVIANPPFENEGAVRASPDDRRAGAHVAPDGLLEQWLRVAAGILKPGGTSTLIHRAEALPILLKGFESRFGALRVKPIQSRPGQAAIRILVQGIKGSRAPLRLLPPLILHDVAGHGFTETAEAILRGGAALPLE